MGKPKYVNLSYKFSPPYRNLQNDFGYVQLAKHRNPKSTQKILIVLDYMPTEDLKSGRILSGATGLLFKRLEKVAVKYYNSETKLNDHNWLAISYHAFKTSGESDGFREGAQKEFKKRLEHIITEYKPDVVLTFGPDPYKALNAAKISKYNGKMQHLFGVPTPTKVKYKGKEHKFKHVPSISLNTMVNDAGKGGEMAIAGYVARNMVNAFHGSLKYKIPKRPDYKTVLVDTIDKFNKMLRIMAKAKNVAIDTESENLNRRANRMLTIQFACSTKRAFVVPYLHKDSPFSPSELKFIRQRLRKYFESKNENKYQIYANASFDLTLLRNSLGVRYFKSDVWDLFAGEFCFDPTTQVLTERGYLKIDDVVDDPNPPKVASFNHDTQKIEYKPLINTSRHTTTEDMYELEYEGGRLRVTGNHKIWSVTRSAYIRIDEMQEDEEVLIDDGT